MKENYATLHTDLLAYMLMWDKTYRERQPSLSETGSKIKVLLDEQAERIRREGMNTENYEHTRFAICAWIDELIMNSEWHHRQQWHQNLLQTAYYRTTNAGEEFFDRLNRLHPEQKAVREIYYVVLCLGFRGRYCWDDDAPKLDQIKRHHYALLPEPLIDVNDIGVKRLIPAAYDEQVRKYQPPKKEATLSRSKTLFFSLMPPAFFIILFGIYYFVLGGTTGKFLMELSGG